MNSIEGGPQNIFFRCVEDSNEAIMISDKRGTLVYVNPAWSRIYGYSKEEALGKTPRILHSGMQPDSFYKNMWADILDPKTGHWKGELYNKAKDGKFVPVLLTITPFRSKETGVISGYMGIAVDMTAKKDLEAKIAHQDRLASVGLLASGLAHEIGTPLGVIRGRAEFLMMQAQEANLKKGLGIITSEIDRITKLIRSLLRISRNFSDVHVEEMNPAAAVSEVLALVGQNLKEDHVDIQVRIPEELKIVADFSRLEQVFLNLIMNSIHAIRKAKQSGRTEGHFLLIEAKPKEEIKEETNEEGRTELRVEDSGCGISPQNMNQLFKPFFTTKDVGEGTGLGLAIVAQLMREMEGKVSVQSTVGKGTVFTLAFKASR